MKKFLINILLIPYSLYTFFEPDLGFKNAVLFFISLFILGVALNILYKKLPPYFKDFFLTLIIYFFYAYIFFKDTLGVIHNLGFHYFSIYFFCFFFLIFFLLRYYRVDFKSSFVKLILIFSITILPVKFFYDSTNTSFINKNYNQIINNGKKLKIDCEETNDTPIVFIVLDELSSDNELKKNNFKTLTKSIFLKEEYVIKDDFESLSKQTKISLPSIFNYNITNDSIIKKYESKDKYLTTSEDLLLKLFKENKLTKDLKSKNWDVNSFGLVDFSGGINHSNFIYEWDRENKLTGVFGKYELIENLFKLSVVNFYEKRDFKNKFPLASKIRKDVFNVLDTINFKKKNFYYFHIYMPHFPYHFPDEYTYKEENLSNYNSYRNFTLNKLSTVLDKKKFNKIKLIVSGDHGYRWDSLINPYKSMVFFKGFDKCNLKKVKYVQDIGSLIISSLD